MKIYALSLIASRNQDGYTKTVSVAAVTAQAKSEEEAIGIGLKMAHGYFPDTEGWLQHGCATCKIPAVWLSVPAPLRAGIDALLRLVEQGMRRRNQRRLDNRQNML